ncbi:MAG: amidophosphoribosyltransferase [Proteobacteria bacterium]|nr:amidophosphoribosyltransferase [Pseudomonadota bacterium]
MSEIHSFKDKCGVFGIINHEEASYYTKLGLHSLQHRGQESCGIATVYNSKILIKKHEGLVSRTFSPQEITQLQGTKAIGHVRYSTSGEKTSEASDCIQPFCGQTEHGQIALAHNGNLVDYSKLKEQLLRENTLFTSDVDTEVILHLIIRSKKATIEEKIFDAVSQIKGAFSLVILTDSFLCAVRDRNGIRPLCLGEVGGASVVSSESCAINAIGGTHKRDITAGEVLFLYNDGTQKQMFLPNIEEKFCIFEYVYFARPDSNISNKSVYSLRKNIGMELLTENTLQHTNKEEWVVVPVPDSGIPSAMGYAGASGLPFEFGIIRNHYVGRTFIDPTQKTRANKVQMKHAPNIDVVKGKKVILVDDSIVRGTTSKRIVQMIKNAGAKEVHMKIASPPTKFPCHYGIDTPCKEDLIANNMTPQHQIFFLGVESLQYISINGLKKACIGESFCLACFDGNYFV